MTDEVAAPELELAVARAVGAGEEPAPAGTDGDLGAEVTSELRRVVGRHRVMVGGDVYPRQRLGIEQWLGRGLPGRSR